MSLDFDLVCNYGAETCVYSGNMTHNVTNMWHAAGVHDALYNSHGMKAYQIREVLAKGVGDMCALPEKYKAMDSPNGWGIYEHAFPFLMEVYKACVKYPDAVIDISK